MGSEMRMDLPKKKNLNFDSMLTHLLSEFITTDLDQVEMVIEKCLQSAARFYEVDECFIGLFDQKREDYSYFFKWTEKDGLVREDDVNTLPLSAFPWSKKRILSGRELRITDVAESKLLIDTPDIQSYRWAGVVSVLIEPLSVKQKRVPGGIALWSHTRTVQWNNEDAHNLRLIGDVIANILDHKQNEIERDKRERYISLLGKFTQYAFESTDLPSVLDKMSEDLCIMMQADFCGFGLLNEGNQTITPSSIFGTDKMEFIITSEIPLAGSVTEQVLRTGKILVIENVVESKYKSHHLLNVTPVRSAIVVPIKINKKNFGAVFISYHTLHKFTDQEIAMCQQAAAQITLSINNMLSYTENIQHIEEMNTLSIVSTALRKAQSLAEMPVKVIDRIVAMKLVESACIVIFEDPTREPSLTEWGGKWKNNKGSESISKLKTIDKVMKTGKVFLDEGPNELTENPVPENPERIRHILGFPLRANNQTLGVMCVGSSLPFKEKTISLLNAISETVSNAVYRQSLFDNLQVHLESLRTTKVRLVQSEKLAAIGELIAGVAHELNNPLTTISLSAELLLQQSTNEQDILDLEKIVSESQRAAKIVKSLLDFSRQHAPERKPVDINHLLKSTADLISWELKKDDIQLSFKFAEDLPETAADPNQLKQVFINIINNAAQAIKGQHKRGEIKVQTEIGQSIFFGGEATREEMIRILFTDTGPGIPPAILPRIFDPFFTTKNVSEGTGLGLSVCHGIISEHKGHIWAKNVEEGGTGIIIEIPIEAPEISMGGGSLSQKVKVNPSDRLLIIEDENSVLEVVQRALMRKGYIVDGVSSGEEGLECLNEHAYSVIICDIRMSGMNGFEFYQEVNKIDPGLTRKIIFTSGDTIKPEYTGFLKLTGASFLPKPFELEHLLEIVQEKIAGLNQKRTDDE